MSVETTQTEFHPMRGHVIEGALVTMDNGDTLKLRATMNGWVLDGPSESSSELPTAAHVERYILSYGY